MHSNYIKNQDVLDLSRLGIRNIKEVKELLFNNPTRELLLYENELTEISYVNSLIELEKLNLRSNKIEKIEGLDKLIKLNELNLSDNNISSLKNVDSLLNLEELHLSNNNIKEMTGIEKLTKLKLLFLGKNNIYDISNLKKLKNLQLLALGSNNIKDISVLSKLRNLKTLILYDNKISDISSLKKLKKLAFLALDKNLIEDINPLANLGNLERLYLSYNSIKDISCLKDASNLKIINLEYNDITNLENIENWYRLEEVFLYGNPINEVNEILKFLKLSNIKKVELDLNNFILSEKKDIKQLIDFFEIYLQGYEIDYKRELYFETNHPELYKVTKNLHDERKINLLDKMIGVMNILGNLLPLNIEKYEAYREKLLFLIDHRVSYEQKGSREYYNNIALKNVLLAEMENTYKRRLDFINQAINYFDRSNNRMCSIYYRIYANLLKILISISDDDIEKCYDLIEEILTLGKNKTEVKFKTSIDKMINQLANIQKNLIDYLKEPAHLKRLLSENLIFCDNLLEEKFPEIIFSNPIIYRLVLQLIQDIKETWENSTTYENSIEKKWKEIYHCLDRMRLEQFSEEIFNDEKQLNIKICQYLRNLFPGIKYHKIIIGKSHIDLSTEKIAIEVKKIDSNTKKDTVIGQILEDLRNAGFLYGIVFGIDLTKTKLFLGYNKLYWGEDRNIISIIKAYPYST